MPTKDDDPVEFFDQEIQRLKQELAMRDQRDQQTGILEQIRAQEAEFQRQHPDYLEAVDYLIDAETRQWEKSGFATVQTNQVREAARLGRNGNPQFQGWADQVEAVAQREDVRREAEKQGRDPEELAAKLIARDTYLNGRRNEVWMGAQASGRNIAENAYELAKIRGYKGGATMANNPSAALPADTQKVLQMSDEQLDEYINSNSWRGTR